MFAVLVQAPFFDVQTPFLTNKMVNHSRVMSKRRRRRLQQDGDICGACERVDKGTPLRDYNY
jgi:hypothetical protein